MGECANNIGKALTVCELRNMDFIITYLSLNNKNWKLLYIFNSQCTRLLNEDLKIIHL